MFVLNNICFPVEIFLAARVKFVGIGDILVGIAKFWSALVDFGRQRQFWSVSVIIGSVSAI